MKEKLSVSVLIVTYKRGHLIGYVFDGLVNQTYKNFDVVVILKPSGDRTEDVIEKYKKTLKIKLIIQKGGYMTDAVNLGLKKVSGEIIAFLDDDAIPFPDWLKNLEETYARHDVGGVAGSVEPAFLNEKGDIQTAGKLLGGLILNNKPFLESIGKKTWSRSLRGLEDYFVYISKAGTVDYNISLGNLANDQITKSLLGMGANMSVLTEATAGLRLPNSWLSGLGYEQFIGWYIWKKGYVLLINPRAKVRHLIHGQTLSRNITDSRKQLLGQVESQLLFYRLYGIEKDLSIMHRITWIIFRTLLVLKQAQNFHSVFLYFKGVIIGNTIGCKLLLLNKFGVRYDPIAELKGILEKSSS